jgi:predicted aconitase
MPDGFKMMLTEEELSILGGAKGETLAKVMKAVILFGEAFGAKHLVPISGRPHLAASCGTDLIAPFFDLLDELIGAGLKSREAFTVNPRPMDENIFQISVLEKLTYQSALSEQEAFEKQLRDLGLKNERAFTCAPYLREVGNRPAMGQMLAWSGGAAVVYANSALGARTNRNPAGIDLMCAILGKAPYYGLLTDEGRKANWKIELRTSELPNPQLLGSAIGMKVQEGVPYITGLDMFLSSSISPVTEAFLKDMGAASAANNAVSLYHVENITPEAISLGQSLLARPYRTYVIDDDELQWVKNNFPIAWKNPAAAPKMVFIGCPHLSIDQVDHWASRLETALEIKGTEQVKIPTYLFTAPDVAAEFNLNKARCQRLSEKGIHLTSTCPLMTLNNTPLGKKPIATNSNTLRASSGARFYLDDEVLQLAVSGELPREVSDEKVF